MKNMKLIGPLILVLLAVSTLQQQQKKKCSPSCAFCLSSFSADDICTGCYNTFLLEDGSCAEELPVPATYNCEIWGKNMICLQCKQGFVFLEYNRKKSQNGLGQQQETESLRMCFKTKSQNGLFGFSFQNGATIDWNNYFFGACNNGGYPNIQRDSCSNDQEAVTSTTLKALFELRQQPAVTPCLWGTRDRDTHLKECMNCNSGRLSISKKCVTGIQFKGCLSTSDPNNGCGYCDYGNGWRMREPGICSKPEST